MADMKEVQKTIEDVLGRNLDVLLESSKHIGVVDVDKVRILHRNVAASLAQALVGKTIYDSVTCQHFHLKLGMCLTCHSEIE